MLNIEKRLVSLDINNNIRKYYGIWVLIFSVVCFASIVFLWGDKIYLPINDVLDSNIAQCKMFRDYSMWTDRTTQVPILGGLDRSILSCGYTISYLLYWGFDTQIAYWLNYILAMIFSSLGFYYMGKSIQKAFLINARENLLAILGIIYVFIGLWPGALIGFSLIPWWLCLILETVRTGKIWLYFLFIPLIYNIPSTLIGIFLLIYTFLLCFLLYIKEKRVRKRVLLLNLSVIISFFIFNGSLFLSAFTTQRNAIKSSLSSRGYLYTDSITVCLKKFAKCLLLTEGVQPHSGMYSLRYFAVPTVVFFFFIFNFGYKRLKISKFFLYSYDLLVVIVVNNAFWAGFDNCYWIRRMIPFMSGFSFARFMWTSSFFIFLAFSMIIHYLLNIKLQKIVIVLVIGLFATIIVDPFATSSTAFYNILHVNFQGIVLNNIQDYQVRWNDYYEPDLFEKIKRDIEYEDEWSISYGLEPAILAYNDIRTLDGYYSNYSIEYRDKWEELIAPVLIVNDGARDYWNETSGIRAYVYGECWIFPNYEYDYDNTPSKEMLINKDILKELGGKFVFSRVQISNADDLDFEYLGTWKDDKEVYKISVYKVLGNE